MPKKLSDELNKRKASFSQYTKSDGWKRLNSLTGDYNRRSDKPNMTADGRKIVSFSDLKRIDHDMRHMDQSKNNLEYQMLGDDTKQWVHDQLGKIRSANKQVDQVKPVPKLEKPKVTTTDTDRVKIGNANFTMFEGGKKRVIIPESKLIKLVEYRGQTMFNFDTNGNGFYGKFNYQHFIDYLESIGRYGMLESSGYDMASLNKLIETFKSKGIDEYMSNNEDDEEVEDEIVMSLSVLLENIINGSEDADVMLSEYGFELLEELKASGITWHYDIRNHIFLHYIDGDEPIFSFLTGDGVREVFSIAKELVGERLDDYGFGSGLKLNDRGLLYVERNITIPYIMDGGDDSPNEDAYTMFKKNYKGLGNCWSWDEGRGESYNGNSFGGKYTDIRMIGCVNPNDVDWLTTISRNIYSLREEREIYIDSGKPVEIDSVEVYLNYDGKYKNIDDGGMKILNTPIIVRA